MQWFTNTAAPSYASQTADHSTRKYPAPVTKRVVDMLFDYNLCERVGRNYNLAPVGIANLKVAGLARSNQVEVTPAGRPGPKPFISGGL